MVNLVKQNQEIWSRDQKQIIVSILTISKSNFSQGKNNEDNEESSRIDMSEKDGVKRKINFEDEFNYSKFSQTHPSGKSFSECDYGFQFQEDADMPEEYSDTKGR